MSLRSAVEAFLSEEVIAIAGVSREGDHPGNLIFRKLRDGGSQVYPVNPRALEVEGTKCYGSLAEIPAEVGAVVCATPPFATDAIAQDCVTLGVRHVWMHRGVGSGSVSAAAVERCREAGITVIPGACPMMFLQPVDPFHRCLRGFMALTGSLPTPVDGSF